MKLEIREFNRAMNKPSEIKYFVLKKLSLDSRRGILKKVKDNEVAALERQESNRSVCFDTEELNDWVH